MKKILFTLFSLVLLLEANPIATLETSKGNIKIESLENRINKDS